MKEMTVAEIRKNFSAILDDVQAGAVYGVLYGRNRKPVAKIVPYVNPRPIKLGVIPAEATLEWVGDGKISVKELLDV
jgi:antitoxin (DNA-binding transcriptional repressor) of toxin-antitoxin stability system